MLLSLRCEPPALYRLKWIVLGVLMRFAAMLTNDGGGSRDEESAMTPAASRLIGARLPYAFNGAVVHGFG